VVLLRRMRRRIARAVLASFLFATGVLAAGITGIWTGQQQGRGGATDDLAFRFKSDGQALTGTVFGDEFDLPIAEASLSGDQVRFTVVTTNYYTGTKVKFVYTGVIKGDRMELVRERVPTAEDKPGNRPPAKQTLTLKRLD
jgi:hypothetical protein